MPATATFLVDCNGTPLAADVAALLTSAYVDFSLRLPDSFMLRFRDPGRIVVDKSGVKIGAKVKIAVATDAAQTPEPLFSGEVTSLEAEFDSTGSFTIIRGFDPTHRLFRGRHTTSYTQTTASDTVTQVARRAGLTPGQVQRSSTVFDHLGQCGQTDWEFLDVIAKRIGYELRMRDDKLDFAPRQPAETAPSQSAQTAPNPLVLRLGSDLLRFRAVVTAAEQVAGVEVRGWDVGQKRKVVSSVPAGTKSVQLPTVTPADMAKPFGDPTYVASDVAYRTQSEADSAAGALAEEIGSSFAEIDAVARGNPKLRADVSICIENAGNPFDGKYTITTARHRYDLHSGGYTTAFSVTGRQERSLYGLAGGGRVAAGLGVVIAQVTDANDPAQQGRVKLTFPWLSDDYVSDWARTVQAGAGKARGALVLPEVGDEVLVAFEQGDPQRPYVLGGLYNGVDAPDSKGPGVIDSSSGAVNRRSFVSRRGHRIDLLDDQGRSDGIKTETGDGKLRIALDAAGSRAEIHSDGTVVVQGTKGVVVDAASAKLELKGRDIEITAAQGVSIKGTKVAVAADATAEFKASGPAVITGSVVKIN